MANNTTFSYGTLSSFIYISLSVFLIILACVAISLNTMLWLYLKNSKTPSVIFIRVILIILVPAILVGLPLQLLVYVDNFKILSFVYCQRSMMISTICLMSSSLMIFWQLAGLTFQRYCFIVGKDHFYILSKTKYWIAVLLILGFIPSAYITYERFSNTFPLSFCFIIYQVPTKQCSYSNNCTRYMIIVTIGFTETTNSIIIIYSTLKLKKYIQNQKREIAKVIGSTRITNFDRLQATNLLWIAYLVVWIPWGLTRILFQIIKTPVTSVTLNDVLHTFGNISSLIVSLVYIKMDSKFSNFIKTKLKSNKPKVNNVIHVC